MAIESLFNNEGAAGVFKGFVDGGMEFHADIVLPYDGSINDRPMHGAYLLIQLETPNESVLGRITTVSSEGKLSSGAGEDYNIRAMKSNYPVSESLKKEYLKYRVNVRVLGGLKLEDGKVVFVPSFRRVPSVGAPVCFPSDDVLKELTCANADGAPIGLYALGEYVYAGGKAEEYGLRDRWMNIMSPEIQVRFDVNAMVARRTFIFARAGFGKSNLNKLLFSQLYKETPMKRKGDRMVPVGTVIFDRDGEYFWPDDSGRPGLCDVEELKNNLVVFTNREAPNAFYGSFVAGGIKMDIRDLPPSVVISLAVSQDRQDHQNIKKLKALSKDDWKAMVDLAHTDGYNADMERVKSILHISEVGDTEATAAISNITSVVKMLHDPNSRFLDQLMYALSGGKLCIVDMSQYSSESALILSGLVLSRIFDHNQREFTRSESKTIPTIAVIEEAQSVLTPGKNATAPFISWVKEGRKYDLGALMITQQPGSIPTDILSQGDNWFVFHLLSDKDLQDVRRANAHFSNDILSSLLNEPIVGQGVFWSSVSVGGNGIKPYPVPIRVLSFENTVKIRDRSDSGDPGSGYVDKLKEKVENCQHIVDAPKMPASSEPILNRDDRLVWELSEVLSKDKAFTNNFIEGIPWGVVKQAIKDRLPSDMFNLDKVSYELVKPLVTKMFGKKDEKWFTERKEKKDGTHTTIIKIIP